MNHASRINRQAFETTISFAKEGTEMAGHPNGIRRSMTLCVAAALLALATHAQAELVLVPPELDQCDQYRLVFVSSAMRDAASSNIQDYNNFVQGVADASAPLEALGQSWKAIGSTAAVDARDNTASNPNVDGAGVPIYLVNGTKIADDYSDLWDGNIDEPISWTEIDQDVSTVVWTGSNTDGTAVSGSELGTGNVVGGDSHGSGAAWIFGDGSLSHNPAPL